jgi:DNA (cytosine-5)-methyltransferase 1
MTHLGLFEGIGGFSLAARWMGWETVAWCEWNEFGQKVLKYHFPNAIGHGDITQTDFTPYANKIDILTGGFPCQPYSAAGKRRGKEDDRHLWPEMLRAIREIAPRYIVGENVLGLVNWNGGLVFDEVCSDLEAEGYEVAPVVIPAAAVNAPHGRDRVFFIAKNTMHSGCVQREFDEEGADIREQRDTCTGDSERICGAEMAGPTPHPDSDGQHQRHSGDEINAGQGWVNAQCDVEQVAIDTQCIGRDAERNDDGFSKEAQQKERREQQFSGTNSPQGGWRNFPSQSPICGGDDGLPSQLDGITFSKWRSESIKAYGNAIVPQVAYEIFKAIEKHEHHQHHPGGQAAPAADPRRTF